MGASMMFVPLVGNRLMDTEKRTSMKYRTLFMVPIETSNLSLGLKLCLGHGYIINFCALYQKGHCQPGYTRIRPTHIIPSPTQEPMSLPPVYTLSPLYMCS